jgi:hypothetical protein
MIKTKLREYKLISCERQGVSPNSLMLCNMVSRVVLTKKGELPDDIKAEIDKRVKAIAEAPLPITIVPQPIPKSNNVVYTIKITCKLSRPVGTDIEKEIRSKLDGIRSVDIL